ncbi:unnamed protein product [Didymodactylos carnosus]|uniref:FLYWCH-type domain-containing protein n=1 Tax=Didymodactylos carnosus TaxID=1234261 RepID=A0A815KQP2_9BILA|nr:unnamed protein product [Didymodactylos carnosus]CAF4293005.1 unnamed protein product [Didymodactylos carnosus]
MSHTQYALHCTHTVCVQCKVTTTTYPNLSVVVRYNHTHLPDESCAKILEIRKLLKRKSTAEAGPIDCIVEEAYNNANRQSSSTDLLTNFPLLHIMKNTLQRHRRKNRPPVPHTIEQLPFPLPDTYYKTTNGESFLLYDGLLAGTRSLIFSSYGDIVHLSQQEH